MYCFGLHLDDPFQAFGVTPPIQLRLDEWATRPTADAEVGRYKQAIDPLRLPLDEGER